LDCVTPPAPDTAYEVTCPHCKKAFVAELLGDRAAPQRGFKCPHCRLFVPYERADERDPVEPAGS
jgi:DNA-directed RNA polymerase subunit RPC12/RpoP